MIDTLTALPDEADVLVDSHHLVESLHRFTVADVRVMVEVGALDSNAPVELEYGLFIAMPPPGPRHASIVRKLLRLFAQAFTVDEAEILIQDAVLFSEDTYYEPDAALLKSQTVGMPSADDVLLAVEVSDSTLRRDRGRKADVYAAAGVGELWIIALPDEALYVYREPSAQGYRSIRKLIAGESVAPLSFPDALLLVAEMLGQTL